MDAYINGYMTNGSYFVYQGVRYGRYTKVRFNDAFLARVGQLNSRNEWSPHRGKRVFHSIAEVDGQKEWRFGDVMIYDRYVDVDPDRDIEAVICPVWYLTPKEMVKKRLSDGTWINYVLPQTLFYIFCLLASLVTYDWPVMWIMGTYIYLRLAYIELSKGELNRGW